MDEKLNSLLRVGVLRMGDSPWLIQALSSF